MRTPTAFERERAEGEGAFFGRSIAFLKRKSVDPLNASEQDNRIQGIFFVQKFKMFYIRTKDVCLIIHLIYNVL